MSVTILPLANQVIRQFADFPDVDMRFASKAEFETAIVNVARIPDGWMAYCVAEKKWYQADKINGLAVAFGSGEGGASSFAELTGDPRDNPALDTEFDNIEALAEESINNIGEMTELETTNKNDLVSAMNELATNISLINQDNIVLKAFKYSNYK